MADTWGHLSRAQHWRERVALRLAPWLLTDALTLARRLHGTELALRSAQEGYRIAAEEADELREATNA